MNETIKTLTERKSTKSYLDRHVERELIDTIVAAGLNAPSGMNRQPAKFVVVTDDNTVKRLSELNAAVMGASGDPFYGARDVIIVLAERVGTTHVQDGSLAMGNLLNAAYSLGIGACWIHRAKQVFEGEEGRAMLKKWGIDADVEGIGFCILGYEKEAKAKTEIKPGRVFRV